MEVRSATADGDVGIMQFEIHVCAILLAPEVRKRALRFTCAESSPPQGLVFRFWVRKLSVA